MDDFRQYLDEQLKDPAFKAEWDSLEPEYQIINAIVSARKSNGLTQKELAARTGITQADISRLENGEANPSLKTIKRLAAALGKKLQISFVDINKPARVAR
ncbi:MAG: helix-turn-helix transcriptional regulator [Treponema sp.]|nr:helix-turn-helix transcriptional regulator [Treponema sp.]